MSTMDMMRARLRQSRCHRQRYTLAWPLAALLVLCAPAAGQERAVLSGTIRSEEAGAPISGATVEFVHPAWTGGTMSGADGGYRITGVPAGRARVRVSHLGHRPAEVEVLVAAGREIVVDFALAVQPVVLEPVEIGGRLPVASLDSLSAPAREIGRATVRTLETGPGVAEVGLAEVARGELGGDDPLDPGSVLYVRGAASDLKLVHFDGAPVYAPFPLGGLLDPFAPDLLNRADVYLGGAPARYDGGLSYVMDLRTRRPASSGARTAGSLDLLSGTAVAEAGVADRFGLLASLRGMHPLSSAALPDHLPYEYGEGLVRGDLSFGPVSRLSWTGFANHEAVSITETATGQRTIDWGNRAGSLRLQHSAGSTSGELMAGFGRYEAALPLGQSLATIARGSARRTRLTLDLATVRPGLTLRYGASVDDQAFDARTEAVSVAEPARALRAAGTVVGAYGEFGVQPAERLSLRAGGRVDRFSSTGEVTIAPRIAATWLVTESASVTLAGGRYHQFLRPPDELLLAPDAGGQPQLDRTLLVGSASHFTAAFEQDLGDGLGLGMEGFYKRFDGLPGSVSGRSNASGVDLWVARAGEGISGWFGYSLAWAWSAAAVPAQSDFSGRHLLSTGLTLPVDGRTDVELRFAYGAGVPYAGIPVRQSADQFVTTPEFNQTPQLLLASRAGTESAPLLFTPDEPFIRIDASISRRWTRNADGRPISFVPFVRVINGLGDRDALFYFLDKSAGDREPTALGALPVIPILGLEWKF